MDMALSVPGLASRRPEASAGVRRGRLGAAFAAARFGDGDFEDDDVFFEDDLDATALEVRLAAVLRLFAEAFFLLEDLADAAAEGCDAELESPEEVWV
jgi:hypothetical protein